MRLFLALALSQCLAPGTGGQAAELVLRSLPAVVLPDRLLRIELGVEDSAALPEAPSIITLRLEQGRELLALEELTVPVPSQLAHGVTVFLRVGKGLQAGGVLLRARLTTTGGQVLEARCQLPALHDLVAELDEVGRRILASGTVAPLPRLRLEQALLAIRTAPDPRTATILRRCIDDLEQWLERGELRGSTGHRRGEAAFRCPIDGSFQPYRLHLPEIPAIGLLLVLLDPDHGICDKIRWPALAAESRAVLLDQGLAVLEWYPAGDRQWRGIALDRLYRELPAIRERHGLADLPLLGYGRGRGGDGLLRLSAQDRLSLQALLLDHPDDAPSAPPELPLPATQRAWLASAWSRAIAAHEAPERAIAVLGPLPADLAAEADAAILRLGEAAAAWTWLAAQARLPGVRRPRERWLLSLPGPAGPIEVLRIEPWASRARVSWQAGRLELEHVGAWHWRAAPPSEAVVIGPPPSVRPASGKASGLACGPLAGYARHAFTVVIGSGEHDAARQRNRTLAQAFLSAWHEHAHGAPPWTLDETAEPDRLATGNLVLIGNPRNNRVLADLVAAGLELPAVWDHRSLRLPGLAAERVWLRAGDWTFACCRPHPRDARRLVVVLDGTVVGLAAGELPLAGLPDVVVLPAEGRAIAHLFDSDWR